MICPSCTTSIFFDPIKEMVFETSGGHGRTFEGSYCPECNELIVISYTGELKINQNGGGTYIMHSGEEEAIVFPLNKNRYIISSDIPIEYSSDFSEAIKVLQISPKASAALSRRCLQNFLHNKLNIKKSSLALEIDQFIKSEKVPSYILNAVDAIRNIGNFAAHPLKDTRTGEIIDVEPGEAEWLLEVLEMLFDFYFIYPRKLETRRIELNEKLKALGKPMMK
ncbi:DUF4145 domain-containing protein [Paenibacillus sp. DP01]|uniref:DUF4145 domain-containing protein n=1 Tax=Paenibacillus sp. DP01 TaxID=3373096 RepID=UPI00384B6F2E